MSNPFSFKTHVEIHNDLQSNKTVVTIEALDTANLLSRIAKIFYENKIDVDSARITTLGERVEDNFYVFDRKTESNVSENKCARLQKSSFEIVKMKDTKINFPIIGLGYGKVDSKG